MLTQIQSEAAAQEAKLLQTIGVKGAGPCHPFEVACAILADYHKFRCGFGFRSVNQQMAAQLHARLAVLRAWKVTAADWSPRPSYERQGRRVCFLTAPDLYAGWDLYAFSNWDLALRVIDGVMQAGRLETETGIDWCKQVHDRLGKFFGGYPQDPQHDVQTRCAKIVDGILAEIAATMRVEAAEVEGVPGQTEANPAPEVCPVVCLDGGNAVQVGGKVVSVLKTGWMVLNALAAVYPGGLPLGDEGDAHGDSKSPTLRARSQVTDPQRSLKKLPEALKKYVSLPGAKGRGGYRIIRPDPA